MRILVTNDDGIDSEGLAVLARALGDLGEVTVVAPDREYSGASAALGALQQLTPEAHRAAVAGVGEAWAVNGPPALCVMFATLGAFGAIPDLVVAGINPGENTGRAVYHSGTVGACVTARTRGISAVAVSQAVKGAGIEGQGADEMLPGQHWDSAAAVAAAVAADLLAERPPVPVVINLNIPNRPLDQLAGWRPTALAAIPTRTLDGAVLVPKPGHTGTHHIRMDWGQPNALPANTDVGAVEGGQVSVGYLGGITELGSASAPTVAGSLERLLGRPREVGS